MLKAQEQRDPYIWEALISLFSLKSGSKARIGSNIFNKLD